MVSFCRAAGEEIRPEDLPPIVAAIPFVERFQNMKVHRMISTKLILDATGERKGWDATVIITTEQPISLTAARERSYIRNTPKAQGREITHVTRITVD